MANAFAICSPAAACNVVKQGVEELGGIAKEKLNAINFQFSSA